MPAESQKHDLESSPPSIGRITSSGISRVRARMAGRLTRARYATQSAKRHSPREGRFETGSLGEARSERGREKGARVLVVRVRRPCADDAVTSP